MMDDQAARFVDTDMSHMSWNDCVCNQCRHVHQGGTTCDAFPEGIPTDIIRGHVTHYTSYPGDRGIVFEPWPTGPRA